MPANTAQPTFAGKNVLITGGLGFIGSNIAHALVAAGAHVTIVDSLHPLLGGNPWNVEDIKNRIEVMKGDVRDEALMNKLVQLHQQECL